MSVHPWMKFYPRDWRGDQALRMVSIAARGLWIECISLMHEASPYGHLVLNGKPVTDDGLARLVGCTAEEVRALLDELLEAGVATQNKHSVIQSRRMIRDHSRSKKGQNSVKRRYSQDTENKGKNDPPNRPPNRTPTTQKPEARVKKDKNKPSVSKKTKVGLPPDSPSLEDQERALAYWRQHGVPATLDIQIDKFRNHHADNVFVSWSRAWTTWYTNAREFAQRENRRGQPKGRPYEFWSGPALAVVSNDPTLADWLKGEEHFYNFGKWPENLKDKLSECPADILQRTKGKDAA